jgi:hypothetical protein
MEEKDFTDLIKDFEWNILHDIGGPNAIIKEKTTNRKLTVREVCWKQRLQ